MTTYESSALPLRNIRTSRELSTSATRVHQNRHNLDIVLAFTSCFGVWLLAVTSLLIAIQ